MTHANRKTLTTSYEGPDRRNPVRAQDAEHVVRFDAKGDPIWEIRADHIHRRRQNDNTVDLLKCLDPESLSLEDDVADVDTGFNPYDNGSGGD